ncbi:hypothetical protein C8J57DRAFT_1722680 [Mycena rebaudengoi]|nr:hypothetical protein C8J57DRAFT_1722680 [Mycena rebaudengoi]
MPSHAPHCFSLLPLFSFSLSVEIVGGGAAACSQQPGQANASASAAFGTGRATATGPPTTTVGYSMHAPPQLQRGRRNGISAREEERKGTGGKPRLRTVFLPRAKLHRFLAITVLIPNQHATRDTCWCLFLGMGAHAWATSGGQFGAETIRPRMLSLATGRDVEEGDGIVRFGQPSGADGACGCLQRGCVYLSQARNVYAHPSQSCSMDLLTHASFQCMLPELFAVVCALKSEPPSA